MVSDLKNKKAISPIIATILLVVVGVILVTIVLNFGKNFTTSSLAQTNTIGKIKVSDATNFVYPKDSRGGTLQINYSPPSSLENVSITITQYQLLDVLDSEVVTLQTPVTLTNNSLSTIQLDCLYEYSLTKPDFTVQLITDQNTYIDVKLRDSKMVCSSDGTGTLADPIIICNAEDLNAVRLDLDANYVLGKDIDLRCFSRQRADGWLPIGDWEDLFSGSFNGNNHKISNLYINDSDGLDLGLFGYLEIGTISNLGLEDLNISGNSYFGGLVGEMDSGEITDCYTTGNIYELSGGGYIGGLAGIVYGGNIINSYSGVNLYAYASGSDYYYGGLIGNNHGDIENCYATGFVSGKKSVGGLIGYNNGDILNSYSTGDVNVLTTNAEAGGGFIGENAGTISNCYSFGDVTRIAGSSTAFGGFAGYGGTITKSYSTGRVIYAGTTNPTNRGFSSNSVSNNNFWDTQTSLQATSGGGAVGKTTAQMKTQSTFTAASWDFTSVWAIDATKNNGYPYLQWQE